MGEITIRQPQALRKEFVDQGTDRDEFFHHKTFRDPQIRSTYRCIDNFREEPYSVLVATSYAI